jgi:thioredoxin reductase (NADPH)
MSSPKFIESEIRVIGDRWSPRVHAIKDFLSRSRVPYRWLDIEQDPDAKKAADAAVPGGQKFPIVIFPDGDVLVDPDLHMVADKLGLPTEPESRDYDLIVVGGGPAGVAASIYAASEGLRTIVVEQTIPGGQASYSAAIENYPGFPEAMTGSDLARRAVRQAERFGVDFLVTRKATKVTPQDEQRCVKLEDGTELHSRTVLLAIGVSFRWLDAPGCSSLVGAGIYYGAATAEATACTQQDVYILGGGNSAGQAALLLAQYARKVVIIALEDSLEETMSKYLVDRIRGTRNIEVRTSSTVIAAEGRTHLERITIQNLKTAKTETVPATRLFVFIGATPMTEWLEGVVERDEHGFIYSGVDCKNGLPSSEAKGGPSVRSRAGRPRKWPLDREPYAMETSTPGLFVAGDVRHDSVKRLTSACGEGATAAAYIARYCAAK